MAQDRRARLVGVAGWLKGRDVPSERLYVAPERAVAGAGALGTFRVEWRRRVLLRHRRDNSSAQERDCLQKESEIMRFKVVLEPSEDGGYTIYVPSLPGCISEGDTEEEALKNIQEAIELYLEPVEDDWVLDEQVVVKEIAL